MASSHPFLETDCLPRWSALTADRVRPDISKAIADAQQRVDAIAAQEPDASSLDYASTFQALEEATHDLSRAWGLVQHLDTVCHSPELREANNAMLPEVSSFFARIPLNKQLWAVLKAWGESPGAEDLDPVRRRHVEETMADFRSSGADLADDKRRRFEDLQAELAEKTQVFSEHVLDSTNAWELVIADEGKLAGLPESARAAARASAESKGYGSAGKPAWRFTLQIPSFLPLMEHLDDRSLREQAWRAMSEVARHGEHDNEALVWEILALRWEKAGLLGKDNFADHVLERRMAGNGRAALDFVEGMHDRILEAFRADGEELARFRAEALGDAVGPMEPWDIAYWEEKHRVALFDFDKERLRPYFPMDAVIEGMFHLSGRLFGVRIEEKPSVFVEGDKEALDGAAEVWHPEVKFFQISDPDGTVRGSFYTDWHPREPKRGGAWMNSLRVGVPPVDGSSREPHLGLMCGNMSPPVDGKPALLTHEEVETVFHEFGHLLHGLLGEVPVRALNGVATPWDFVELPSQIMENFCWDRESLDFFARHHETGEPIPEELFRKMLAARNHRAASVFMRQLAFGKLDLELHLNYEKHVGRDLDELSRELLETYLQPTPTPPRSMAPRFTHLFSSSTGYAAGYYSYKWAEVLDADAFTRFQKEGVLNPETGMAFREAILSKGNSAEPEQLFRDFMGRDPDSEALLLRAGLV